MLRYCTFTPIRLKHKFVQHGILKLQGALIPSTNIDDKLLSEQTFVSLGKLTLQQTFVWGFSPHDFYCLQHKDTKSLWTKGYTGDWGTQSSSIPAYSALCTMIQANPKQPFGWARTMFVGPVSASDYKVISCRCPWGPPGVGYITIQAPFQPPLAPLGPTSGQLWLPPYCYYEDRKRQRMQKNT